MRGVSVWGLSLRVVMRGLTLILLSPLLEDRLGNPTVSG